MEEQRGCAQVVNISSIFEIMRDKKLSLGTKKLLLNSKNIAPKLLKYQQQFLADKDFSKLRGLWVRLCVVLDNDSVFMTLTMKQNYNA